MNKNQQFFLSHLLEHTAQKMGVSTRSLQKVAQKASFIGNFSYIDCIKKLANQPEEGKRLVNLFGEEVNEEDKEDAEAVDEGEIKQHDTLPITTQNPLFELSGITPYSTFSVPEGISG